MALSDRPGDARISSRQARSRRAGARLRGARADRGNRLSRRASGRAPASLHNAIAYSTEGIEIWFARGLVAGERELDAGEFLDVFEASAEELEAAAQRGELTDAKTLIGLLWLQNWRAGRWPLQWRRAPWPES